MGSGTESGWSQQRGEKEYECNSARAANVHSDLPGSDREREENVTQAEGAVQGKELETEN